jgi:hypothetical protein
MLSTASRERSAHFPRHLLACIKDFWEKIMPSRQILPWAGKRVSAAEHSCNEAAHRAPNWKFCEFKRGDPSAIFGAPESAIRSVSCRYG